MARPTTRSWLMRAAPGPILARVWTMICFRTFLYRLAAGQLPVILALGLSVGCHSPEPEVTRDEFCGQWAIAACSSEVVSVCQASSADACRVSQRAACHDALPDEFVDRGVEECIEAVKSAYKDADLTAKELDVVSRYGGACSDIFIGNDEGGRCSRDADCEPALRCVLKDEERGSCQQPLIIEPGFSCSEPAEACTEGFYCDGKNCLAALAEGAPCDNDTQCGPSMFCDETCAEKVGVGDACSSDSECLSGICSSSSGERICLDRLRLSPAEPMCATLK